MAAFRVARCTQLLTRPFLLCPINRKSNIFFCRSFSLSQYDMVKRKWRSTWKNRFSDKVYTEAEFLDERCFDKILAVKNKSKEKRRIIFKCLLDRLVRDERIIVSFSRGRGVARLAELLIDKAKDNDEPGVYNLMQRKELIPRVFEDLLPRYKNQDGGYVTVYRTTSEVNFDRYRKYSSQYIPQHEFGCMVVEFNGNPLPPILPSKEKLERLTAEYLENMKVKHLEHAEGTTI